MKISSWLIALALVILTAYLNAFSGAFQFDDYNVIVNYRPVHTWEGWLADLPHGIRPLLKFSYTLNWTSGLGLFGFHLVNLSIHCANSSMIYLLSRRFCQGMERSVDPDLVALLAALSFALHPVQTEAVTYISGRSTSLMALLYLASLLAYVRGTDENWRGWRSLISPVLFVLAILTKEVAVTLPLSLILWDYCQKRPGGWHGMLRRQAAHWCLLFAILLALLFHPRYSSLLGVSLTTRTLHDNLLTQVNGIWYLVSRLLLLNQLNIDPDLPVVTTWAPQLAAKAALLACALLGGIWNMRRRPWVAFGLLWFLIHMLPTNSLLPRLDVANERQLYLAGWGLFLIPAHRLSHLLALSGPLRGALQVATVLLLTLLLTVFTIKRNVAYQSEIALWEDTALKSPRKARIYNNLGYAYALAGRHRQATAAYRTAVELDPQFTLARDNLTATESDLQRRMLLQWHQTLLGNSMPGTDQGALAAEMILDQHNKEETR